MSSYIMVKLGKIIHWVSVIVIIWVLVTLSAILTLPSSPSGLLRGNILGIDGESSLTYPLPSPGSYCASWSKSSDKSFWTDLTSAYASKKVQSSGWSLLQTNTNGVALVSSDSVYGNYSALRWAMVNNVKEQTNMQLFLIPLKANMIFTRMYVFKDDEGSNLQTARLGIDYACDGQLFNHVPGASAFCRKDYLQMYFLDYEKRYADIGQEQCYSSITPKSFLLSQPDHCRRFLKVLETMMDKYNETSWPIEWITKSALRHKGYGIKLVDFELAHFFYTLYGADPASCDDIDKEHQQMIIQKYINNPALIEGRKFDFRVFVFCLNADPLVVGWAPNNGHTRLSDQIYDEFSNDFTTHITANVAGQNPESLEFLKKYRFNLREIGEYFKDKIGDVDTWLSTIAYPKVKKILIHMFRASQQNFLIKRSGLFEFYGVDFIMDNTYTNFYLLESNRRPDVQEKNPKLQYREDMIVEDVVRYADYLMETGGSLESTEEIFSRFKAFEKIIDETSEDPYLGVLEEPCSKVFKDMNWELPIDPMIQPLKFYVDNY